MRITQRQLRQIIREELLVEKQFLKRIDSVARVQRALNKALENETGYVPLEIDKQWGPLTDAAWFMFVDRYYKPEPNDPTADEVKNKWETAGVKLGYVTSGNDLSNAANAAEFIESFLEDEPGAAVAAPPVEGDSDSDGRLSDDELIALHGSSEIKGMRLAGQHPWRLESEPDSLPANLTLDKFANWSYTVYYDGPDYKDPPMVMSFNANLSAADQMKAKQGFSKDPTTATGEVANGTYYIETLIGERYSYALNEWYPIKAERLRANKFMYSLVVGQSEKDEKKRPVFLIWADDGQIPEGVTTHGFTIKTLRDFNRVFGSSVKESIVGRWSKLAGLIRD